MSPIYVGNANTTNKFLGNNTSDPGSGNAEGDFYYNTTLDKFRYYDGSSFKDISAEVGSVDNPATDVYGQLRTKPSGNYWIKPTGFSSKILVQVNNTDNGGGWVLCARVQNNNMDHYNTGVVNRSGSDGPRTTNTNTQKLSDAEINAIRSSSSYSGSTGWWMQSLSWSQNNSYPANCFIKTGTFSFSATDSANNVNDKTICATSFEGSLSDRGPNTGTRGLGDHHTDANYFAWVRHPESGGQYGFRQDTRGISGGYLWVK
tara:strand:+ start:600 stop:1379 length:780 start_codon:yes stop_codon:yes gene_type:complete